MTPQLSELILRFHRLVILPCCQQLIDMTSCVASFTCKQAAENAPAGPFEPDKASLSHSPPAFSPH